jgi:hypothetical protein
VNINWHHAISIVCIISLNIISTAHWCVIYMVKMTSTQILFPKCKGIVHQTNPQRKLCDLRLGHSASYSKFYELDHYVMQVLANASSKFHTNIEMFIKMCVTY